MTREKEIYRITIIGGVVSVLLTALKFVAGVLGASAAMLADAVHSLSDLLTTAQVFGEQLHSYTVVHAIADENVLPFRMEYIRTMKAAENIADEEVQDINRESALLAARPQSPA